MKDERGIEAVDHLSFDVRRGEIVGIAGIDGNGQTELVLALNGLMKIDSGSVDFKGRDISSDSPRQLFEDGVAHIPEDRHKYGLILDFPLDQNMALKHYYKEPYSQHGFINQRAITDEAVQLIDKFDVRTSSAQAPAASLSGGNQQKAIIAREIAAQPDLLYAANPTRGLDVGAIEYIHKALIDERDRNKGVLLMSFELDEIMNLSDRILVMFDGKIVANIPASETNTQELGLMMAGTPYEEVLAQRQKGVVESNEV